MCGVLLVWGPGAREQVHGGLDRLRHRGPDDWHIWQHRDMALGFARLAITDEGPTGRQPHESGHLVTAVNGEIYNYEDLAEAHGLKLAGTCDAHIVGPLFDRVGPRVIDLLDGFYSAVVVSRDTGEVFCLRDHMGKKPLFVGRSDGRLFVTSELKAFDRIDWFEALPRGVVRVDRESGRIILLAEHRPPPLRGDIEHLLEEAVQKRLPRPPRPVGLFLSGGLDSSIVAALAVRDRPDIVFYTLGSPDSPDRQAVDALVEALRLRDVRAVPGPRSADLPALIDDVVYATESYNPSIVSNGLATYLLARAARRDGLKVVLTGEGADELFGGYHHFRADEPWRAVRQQLMHDMQFTELRRLDRCTMAHGIEARCPFLDRAVSAFSDTLGHGDLYGHEHNKVTLRRAFAHLLPAAIVDRRKTSFDVGSGIRGAVVRHLRGIDRSERTALRDVWRRRFDFDPDRPYFHRYPVFDDAIDRRGETHR